MTKYEGDPPHIRRAKELLTQALERHSQKTPSTRVTLAEIFDAEQAVSDAEASLQAFQEGDSNLRQAISPEGVVSVVVERGRAEKLETLRAAVQRRYQELARVKRQWLAGSLES